MRAVLVDEGDEVLDSAGASVVNRRVLLASSEQLDGGEALDLIRNIVGGSVDLGDGDELGEGIRSVQLAELLVLGSKSLAVTAPWRVELDENVLVVVDDDILVVLGDDDCDGAVVGLGDGLRLDAGVDLAGEELVDEGANVLDVDLLVLVVGELLVLLRLLDGERGPLVGLEVEVAGVLAKRLGVNGSEVDLALVLEGQGLELLGELLALLGGRGEDVGEGDAGGHVVAVGLGADLADERGGGDLGEGADGVSVELVRVDVLAVVEGLVQDEAGLLDTLGLCEGGVVGGAEEEVVAQAVGDRREGLVRGLVVGGDVGDEDDLVGRLELGERGLGHLGDGGQGLLGHVRDEAVGLALAAVGRDILGATEDLEGGVALDAVLLAQVGLLGAVDLDEGDVLLLERRGGRLVLGGEGLAVAAPGREDCAALGRPLAGGGGAGALTLGEDQVVVLDEALERVLVELLHVRRRGNGREEGGAEGGVLHRAGKVQGGGGGKDGWDLCRRWRREAAAAGRASL